MQTSDGASVLNNVRELPRDVWILFGGTFINRFGTFVLPFLVIYLTRSGHSASEAALAVSAYGAGHLIAASAGGDLADRIGRRQTIGLAMFVSAAAMTALSVAASFPLILGLVLLAGASAEMYRPAAAALIGDLVEPGKRVTAFAVFRLAMNLGSAAGPATAGFLASHSFRYVFLGDALSSVVYGLVALLALPDLRRTAIRSGYARGAVRHALANRAFVTFIAATLCVTWIEYQVSSTFPLYVRSLGYSMTTYGYLLSLNGLLVVLFELSLTALTQRFQTQSVIAAGYALFGIGYAAVGLAHGTPMLVAAVVLWTCGEMVFAPVTGAYVTNLAPAEYRGRYSGMYVLTWSIGMLLGPSLGMLLFDRDSGMYFAAVAFAGVTGASLALVRPRAALASATQ